MIRKVVIPAAGLGTRFLPITKSLPKEMLPIIDKPVIQYVVEEAILSGVEDILIITARGKRAIEDYFDSAPELESHLHQAHKHTLLKEITDLSSMANVYYIRQKEPKGLGDAILKAEKHIGNEPFAVLLGDDVIVHRKPALQQLIDDYQECKSSVIGVETMPKEELHKYGVIDVAGARGPRYEVRGLVEKSRSPPSDLAIIGRYILTPKIFSCLHAVKPGHGGEIQLTDALSMLLADEKIYARKIDGVRYDIGDKLGYMKAIVDFALMRDDLKGELTRYLKEKLTE